MWPSRSIVLLGLSAVVLASCSGGGSSAGVSTNVRCADGSPFCLVSCDLGCGSTSGCAVSEIAENQQLHFVFNKDLDFSTVNGGNFSIRTATGQAPDGRIRRPEDPVLPGESVMQRNTLTFIPSISVTNGISSFGFHRNETYIISLVGGSQSVRSTSGNALSSDFSCTVTASRGIIDEDNAPPRGDLVAPTNLTAAPFDSTIVVRFSEVIDSSPFQSAVGPSTPIRYLLRRSRVVGGERQCDIDGVPIQLEGVPRVTLETLNNRLVTGISLRPQVGLPGLACVEVEVTSDVHDLAGNNAIDSVFHFITAPSAVGDTTIVEDFLTADRMDVPVSGGTWQNGAHPSQLGGDGHHGTFNPSNGQPVGTNEFEWSTEQMTIPAAQTLTGQDETVTDGRFFFTDFTVPEGTTIRFAGANPAQIFVRGRCDIRGTVRANAAGAVTFQCRNTQTGVNLPVPGQPAFEGGAGGRRGGKGGDRCLGAGPSPAFNGENGLDLRLAAGHAYS